MNPAGDPAAPNAFAAAVQWLEGILLGTIASTVAVIAVASVGFLLMSGRIDVRRAAQVIFGCFILFGATSIASEIMSAVNGTGGTVAVEPPPPPVYTAAPVQPARPATPYDPYAGAALPTQ